MSVFSPYAGIGTPAPVTAQSPIEELYAKWMVAAAVFFVVLEIAYLAVAGLSPLGKPWVVRLGPRQRRLRDRIIT